ncbi:MAG: transglycosylase SLT domain-containing protein, partial [Pseudomonadales bacterium]
RYDGQRPLVAAAYNAGRSRVNRWVRNRSGMPMDAWIETIPLRETRNYVKNVLAFAKVYGQLMGNPMPMLQAHEVTLQ